MPGIYFAHDEWLDAESASIRLAVANANIARSTKFMNSQDKNGVSVPITNRVEAGECHGSLFAYRFRVTLVEPVEISLSVSGVSICFNSLDFIEIPLIVSEGNEKNRRTFELKVSGNHNWLWVCSETIVTEFWSEDR